ncbi:MAG: hypothetical protein FWG92_04265 [Leptospirales bacterium]|nr:hypothetical protein [Leptospirales bacterium]
MKKVIIIFLLILFGSLSVFAEEQNSFDWFWFLYEKEFTQTNGASFTVRPFYTEHVTPKRRFDASLMPVFFWRYQTESIYQVKGFFTLYNLTNYTHSDRTTESDLAVFPFLFYGHDSVGKVKDNYILIWPLGGSLNGKLSYEKVSTAIFPGFLLFFFFPPAQILSIQTTIYVALSMLPVYSSWSRGDYKAYGLFWPLFMRGKSPTRDDIRILPVYGHKKKTDYYKRYSFFMLLNYSEEYYSKDTRKTFFFFPFVGRKWSDSERISAWTILWPFFSWGRDEKQKSYMYNLPWPLVQIEDTESPKRKKRIFFPFYGEYMHEKNNTLFVTPFFIKLSRKSRVLDSTYYTNLIVVWWHKRDYHANDVRYGEKWRHFKIWPLLSIEYDGKENFAFNMLSLLPFRDAEGYEKLYEPFWSLIEYRRFSYGEKRLGILMRTYYQRWGSDFFQCKAPFVFSYKRVMNEIADVSFLFSMFGYKMRENGGFLRLFWVPLRISNAKPEISESLAVLEKTEEKERWERTVVFATKEASCVRGGRPNSFYFSRRIF